jgi:hypothetical protein
MPPCNLPSRSRAKAESSFIVLDEVDGRDIRELEPVSPAVLEPLGFLEQRRKLCVSTMNLLAVAGIT